MIGRRHMCYSFVVATLFLVAGCGVEPSGPRPISATTQQVNALTTNLPQGIRNGIWSPQERVALIVTRRDADSAIELDSIDVGTGKTNSSTLAPDSADFVGLSLASDVKSNSVWVAWGHELVRYDLATHGISRFTIPPASAPEGGTTAAQAMLLANQELFIAMRGSYSLERFDITTDTWETSLVSGVSPTPATRLLLTTNGIIELGRDPSGVTSIVNIDAANGKATPTSAVSPVALYWDGADVGYVQRDGQQGDLSPDSNAAAVKTTAPPVRDVSQDVASTDVAAGGLIWTTSSRGDQLWEVSANNGRAVATPFPVKSGPLPHVPAGVANSGGNVIYNPNVEALVPIDNGRVMILTRAGSTSTGTLALYSPVYIWG